MRQLVGLDAALEPAAAQLEEASIAAREALTSLRRYVDGLEADPARQEWVEARLAALETVARKHRIDSRELPPARDALAAELAELESGAVSEAELQQRLAAARDHYLEGGAGAVRRAAQGRTRARSQRQRT